MPFARILDEEQLDEMAELRERGWSYRKISNHFAARGVKVSIGSIAWQCLRLGADIPAHRQQPKGTHNGRGRGFTAEEDARLLELERQGMKISHIAAALGRRHNSVRGRLYTLARHEARLEAAE